MNKEYILTKKSAHNKILPKNPFIFDREDRITGIKCPQNCGNLLSIKYFETGGKFVCECGFELK